MEPKSGMSFAKLFNLQPLMIFQLPQPSESDSSETSSEEECVNSQGRGAKFCYANGDMKRKPSDHIKRRISQGMSSFASVDAYSDDQNYEENNRIISEHYYQEMVGSHAQKYRKINNSDTATGTSSVKKMMPNAKHGYSTKPSVKNESMFHEINNSHECYKPKYDPSYKYSKASSIDSPYLDIGDGIIYRIPPTYDKLAASLKLPNYSDIKISEYFLKGTLDLRSLAAFVASDKRFEARTRGCMPEPKPQYESLQARLKALYASNSSQKFNLQVYDDGVDAIPEGAAGKIRRSIMSESGSSQVYYVKVLEKGDTYEIIERSLPKKQSLKKDPSILEKEEMDKITKLWVNIARRDIPRHHRSFTNLHKRQIGDAKRFSETCQREVKMKFGRSIKMMRGAAIRTRKLARDMLLYWKRIDKEQAEQRKIKEKEAAEALKREEELREAKRQKQRLNFLLSQTELYSHFMQNKDSQPSETLLLEVNDITDDPSVPDEDPEEAQLKREAVIAAKNAVSQQKKITNSFDDECSKLRQAAEINNVSNDPEIPGTSNIDLLNPSTMPATSSVQAPELFKGTLKDYQLKGLQWLVNCYEQGLNGILADEMGLGKTIQAMAFLAHLAEEKNIWGPFLVVAPSSVLTNWADEISKFIPDLEVLPYWGKYEGRETLRKKINPKRLYRRQSGFHILVTSYQLLVTDEKYLKRVKWQYMVLDEAQAIKSSNSQRWKTLLSFNCRNRLLLTGTPIQNNMAELWALLHFIMPTLFDSHEQFNEWFSKGIEGHAEHGDALNEHQLNRLHAVLKPFMLRRIKKDVVEEMTSKEEITLHCKLSSRQQAFYQAIKNKFSLAEFLDRGHVNDKKLLNLMNIVIQLRKVCNHPELFERNEGSSFLHFAVIPNSLSPAPYGEPEYVHYAGHSNPISYNVPKLVYEDIIYNSFMMRKGANCNTLERFFSIFSPVNVHHSALARSSHGDIISSGSFGFLRLMDISPAEASFIVTCSFLERLMLSMMRWEKQIMHESLELFLESEDSKERAIARMLLIPAKSDASILISKPAAASDLVPLVVSHNDRFISNVRVLRSSYGFIPKVRAPPIRAQCSDRGFAYQTVEELHHPWTKKMFLGFARTSDLNGPRMPCGCHHLIQEANNDSSLFKPILQLPYQIFGSSPPMRSFDPAKMLTDSGKLQTLDILLKRLRAGNHRVLLFAQMTKMLNIIEDYMNYRRYKYFRLDGSTNISDRRDMVRDFQKRNDIFVFLLSTRAGGLGINLTAADTVIFYESDWNPTLDLQAMDRAHRLGQTKKVTVYRLILKETIEEKILQRASQKNTVQQLVMTGGHVQDDVFKPEDVVSFLIDDAQLEQKLKEIPFQAKDRQKKKKPGKGVRVDADGIVSIEDVDNLSIPQNPYLESAEPNNASASNKKRKSRPDSRNPPIQQNASKSKNNKAHDYGEDDNIVQRRPSRSKRAKKPVNEKIAPSCNSVEYNPHNYGGGTI